MKIKNILIAAFGLLVANGCTDLTEEYFSVVPTSEYGQTPSEIKTIAGSAYSSLRGFSDAVSNSYPTAEYVFFLQECVSDEACIPTRGADWYDGGRYQEAQTHDLQANNAMVLSAWRYAFQGISTCNYVIFMIEDAGLDPDVEAVAKAEVRGIRAYYYYLLLDWFGNVPIATSYTDTELPATQPRAKVYEFVENELTEIVDLLQPGSEYGRFTQNVCNTLLGRLYINSEVFIGTPRWQDCLDACDKVGGYTLMPNTLDNFVTENQNSSEIIFALPYDNKEGTLGNILNSLTYHYAHWQVFGTSQGAWTWAVNGICGQPGVYSSFEPQDARIASMCEGAQIRFEDGDTVRFQGDNLLIYTEEIEDYFDAKQNEGVRLAKYEAIAGEQTERDHDLVIMRWAEILMMKAECHLRLGNASAAAPFVNELRQRSGLAALSTITLEALDTEWLHEFLFEGLRRSVNIRFGTYFEPWWSKPTTTPIEKAIFPIPETELAKNNKLVQNPSY